jgi:hypothetical protein
MQPASKAKTIAALVRSSVIFIAWSFRRTYRGVRTLLGMGTFEKILQ